ncbi:MAG TPA: hypothetical protein DEP66_05145, partial [Acidimicrobiaceae bacterium]|nr:hypothetical protein [Acidimicrobiaceae bacterium]
PFGHLTKLLRSGAVVGATAPGTEESGPAESSMGGRLSVEPEMCFEIAEPLDGHVDPADVPGRIASACAGFEINERRVRAAGNPALLVADNLTNWAVVRGGGVPPPAAAALDDTRVVLTCDGETRLDCRGADHLDNPYESIAALCATLGSHGLSLRPGDLVITGAYARFDLAAGETWRAEYSGIGAVELRVAAEDSRTAAA